MSQTQVLIGFTFQFQHGATQECDLYGGIFFFLVHQQINQFFIGQQPVGDFQFTGIDAADLVLGEGRPGIGIPFLGAIFAVQIEDDDMRIRHAAQR